MLNVKKDSGFKTIEVIKRNITLARQNYEGIL